MGPNTDSGNAKILPAFLKNRFALAAIAAALILLPAAAFAADPRRPRPIRFASAVMAPPAWRRS